jgi:hypothetical protein
MNSQIKTNCPLKVWQTESVTETGCIFLQIVSSLFYRKIWWDCIKKGDLYSKIYILFSVDREYN